MLWKILSGLAAVCLGGGLWFAYQNQGVFKEELLMKERSEQNLAQVKKDKERAAEVAVKKKKELEELT